MMAQLSFLFSQPSSPGEYDSAFSGDDVYPASRHNAYLSNGYDSIDNR